MTLHAGLSAWPVDRQEPLFAVAPPDAFAAPIHLPRLLNSHEVAALLRVSESTLSRWRTAGSGPPFVRFGGIARYREEAVERWLERLESGHEVTD